MRLVHGLPNLVRRCGIARGGTRLQTRRVRVVRLHPCVRRHDIQDFQNGIPGIRRDTLRQYSVTGRLCDGSCSRSSSRSITGCLVVLVFVVGVRITQGLDLLGQFVSRQGWRKVMLVMAAATAAAASTIVAVVGRCRPKGCSRCILGARRVLLASSLIPCRA